MAKMQLHFIPVRYKKEVVLPGELVENLPKRLILFTTIQYHNQLDNWKRVLEEAGKEVHTFRPKHSVAEGHLLGCGIEKWDVDADAFLYVGDGLFHPKALVINNELPVYLYDPKREEWNVMKDEDIELAKKKQKAAMSTFLMSKKIGVLITTKYGQQRIQMSMKLKEKYPDKEFFFLLFDSLDWNSLEDFPFLECFVNTMCPRIGLDDTNKLRKPVLDIGELGFEW
jgi:2-(3-amino-3-carboxypropyl)histidine synthase